MDNKLTVSGIINDDNIRKSGSMYFPVDKLVAIADKRLKGKAALRALNYFTGMPVDDLIDEIEMSNPTPTNNARNIDNFISNYCVVGEEFITTAKELYDEYVLYAKHHGLEFMTQAAFGRIVGKRFGKGRSNNGRFYKGVGLK